MHTTLTKSEYLSSNSWFHHVLSAQTHYLECWWWRFVHVRQFRHPSSCPARMRFFFVFTFIRTNLMAFIGRWPVSGTVFIDLFHVSSYTLCRLNQSDDLFCCLPIIKCCFQHVFHNRSIVSRLLQFLLFISVRLCCLSKCRWCEEWRGMIVGEAKIAANFACRISRNARLEDDAPAKKAAVGWLYTHTRRCLVCRNLSTAWIDPQVYR